MNTYTLDTATAEVVHHTPVPANCAVTDDAYFVDPTALKDPAVLRALGDIYQSLRRRRFQATPPADPTPPHPERSATQSKEPA